MPNIHSFAADYSEARDKFLAAAQIAGATTYRYDNPDKGPAGEALSTDVARIGPEDASKVVMTISSTHGVEGYCGSGFQVDWLASVGAAGLPEGHGGADGARHQPLRLRLDAARDGGGQRPQPQLRRSFQALSGERGLSRDRRLPDPEGPQRRRDQGLPRPSSASYRKKVGDIRLFPRHVGRPVQPSGRHVLRRRRPVLVQPHPARHRRQVPEGPQRRGGDRLPYRPRPLRLRRADHALRHRHAGLAPRARVLGRVGDRIQARPDRLAGARRARPLRPATACCRSRRRVSPCAPWSTAPSTARAARRRSAPTIGCTNTAIRWARRPGPIRAAMRRQFYPDTDDWKEAVLFRGHQIVRQAIAGVQRGAI